MQDVRPQPPAAVGGSELLPPPYNADPRRASAARATPPLPLPRHRYIDFKSVEGSYVYKHPGKVWKVPSTPSEALSSSLMGIFQKNRFRNFLKACANWKRDDPATHKGMDPTKPMQKVYEDFGLDGNTQDFVGHALALHTSETYKAQPCAETIEKIVMYAESVARYGSSPYLYPLYGLGELPQGEPRAHALPTAPQLAPAAAPPRRRRRGCLSAVPASVLNTWLACGNKRVA